MKVAFFVTKTAISGINFVGLKEFEIAIADASSKQARWMGKISRETIMTVKNKHGDLIEANMAIRNKHDD